MQGTRKGTYDINSLNLESGSWLKSWFFSFTFAGFSDLNIAGSATTTTQAACGTAAQDTSNVPRKLGSHPPTSARVRKRRRGGKTSWGHGGGRCAGQESLDKALASFLNWQQSAEERLLSLEEARLERELQAEERREEREERRAEQERQHELRLFSMLTGALFAVRQAAPTATQTEPSVSPQAHLSSSPTTTAAPSVSSQPPSEAPTAQSVYTQETKSSQPTPVKACNVSQNSLATLRGVEAPGHSVYLSNRGNSIRQHQGILQEGYIQYGRDRHHDTDNPDVSEHQFRHVQMLECAN